MADSKAKIVLEVVTDAKKAEKQMKNIDGKFKKLSFGEKVKKQFEQAKKGVEALGQSGDKLTKFGDFFTAGKLGVLALGITALVKVAKSAFDDLFLSMGEKIKKAQIAFSNAQTNTNTEKTNQNVDNGYIQRLQELSEVEKLSNLEKKEALFLIQELNKRYGDLGITIDSTTGKIIGLSEAQQKILQQQGMMTFQNLKNELNQIKKLSSVKTTFALTKVDQVGVWEDVAQGMFSLFGKKMPSVEKFEKFLNGLNLEDQIRALTSVSQKSTDEKAVDAIQEVIQLKKKQLEIEKQIKQLQATGTTTAEEYAKKLKEQSTRSVQARYQKIAENYQSKSDQNFRIGADREEQDYYKNLKTDQQRISFLTEKREELKLNQQQLFEDNKKIQSKTYADEGQKAYVENQIKKLEKFLAEGQKDQTARKMIQKQLDAYKAMVFTHDGDRAVDTANIEKNIYEITNLELEIQKLNQQIQSLKAKSKNYYDNQKTSLDNQLEYQKLLLQGRFSEAEKLKLINDLKRQGLIIDQKQVDAILQKQKALKNIKVNEDINNFGKSVLDRYPQKSSDVSTQRINDIEKANQMTLSDSQKEKIKKLTKIQYDLGELEQIKPNFSSLDIKTNQLTARGGFSTGAVVMADKDRINQQIASYSQRQTNLLNQIKNILQNGGVI